ncbi:pentapeptide repeat-containing protein [Campylobacter coli]|nr:pentapeptide repeat-containing protein [Campylobacter coli]EJA4884564.1 pentapeptide repeat-containing protein [Campylobacter coli]EJV0378591.1 pentapeptide repeat-containing protein [Campylobacter coli]EKH8924014.1 pentapeptide repeat-containing protein [Campylobacter coli]ELD5137391.1 pentapeptide repeat-containing protein [Campylobacter coli]
MEELTKEQRQIIEEEIKKEIKKADTFLKPESINKIIQDIIGNIKGNFKYPKNLEEILSSIPQKVYVSLGKEEIKQILKLDFCCFVDNVFYIDFAPKIEPYEHNQNKTAIEEQRIIQCSYDDLLYLFKTYPLIFNHCIFDYKIDKKTPIEQIKKLSFLNCNFKKEIYLHFQECLDIFQMDNCVFEDRVTIKGKFNDNVYFNNSIFKNYANFHTCEFEKTANFYGVRFNKTPNFSQAIFRGNLNAVNANLNFTFDDLQERIKQEYEDFNKNIENKKSLDKFANDFRDSFRTFKNALIKDNNLLDASNFHKYELYCKEIELKQNWDKRGENVKNTTDLEKNVSRIRDFMDFLLLGFYRKLCDHHTDFLKVFNNLILLIALYALFVFGFTWLHDDKLEDTRAILTLFGFFDKFRLYFDIISTIFVVFGCGFFVCKLDSYEKKNNVSKKQNINFIYIIGDFLNLIKSLLFASFIPCVFYVLFSLFGFFLNLGKDFGYSLLINTLFVSLYICLVYTKSLFFGRYVVLIFSYIVFIIMLIKQPNVIHPLIGKIANESDKFFNYPSLIVLNILYTILLALVLFSLQKTARKNSIVPS